MATFDRLPAEQRAIIELVLRRGQTYEELSALLDMPAARVRELAREALAELAPHSASGVDPDWRGQIADYVLGQQSGPESTATRGHLRRSEPARTWAISLLDSLADLYPNGAPEIPAPDPGARAGRRDLGGRLTAAVEAAPPRVRRRPASSRRALTRRRLAAGAIAAAALAVVLLWVFGAFDGDGGRSGGSAAQPQPRLLQVANLNPTSGGKGAGAAAVFERGSTRTLVVQAGRLQPSGRTGAYEVWLYNSRSDTVPVGAQLTDALGNFQATGPLPSSYRRYRTIVMSRERLGTNPKAPTRIVLRGTLQDVPAGTGTSTTP